MNKLIENWSIYIQTRSGLKSKQTCFEDIWEKYYKRLHYFTRNIIGNETEDVLQDIMLKIWDNLENYKPAYAFSTWAYAIARNHCINHMKKHKMKTISGQGNIADRTPLFDSRNPEKQLIDKETRQQIDTIIHNLDQDLRQMAFLRFYENMKCRDIAAVMHIPIGTVKSRLYGIRQTLKKALEKFDEIK